MAARAQMKNLEALSEYEEYSSRLKILTIKLCVEIN